MPTIELDAEVEEVSGEVEEEGGVGVEEEVEEGVAALEDGGDEMRVEAKGPFGKGEVDAAF